jgi:SM-20-related protein
VGPSPTRLATRASHPAHRSGESALEWVLKRGIFQLACMATIFDQPPPYWRIENWLGVATADRLLSYAKSHEHLFKDAKIGSSGIVDPTQRRSSILAKLGDLKAEIECELRVLLPTVFERLRIVPFVPSEFEIELAAHGDGAFFKRHMDTATGSTGGGNHRVISAVYYCHALPKAFTGGVLRLHSIAASGQPGTFVDIEPDNDMLVFFPSWTPHEVLSVSCPSGRFLDSRFAVNCWVYRGPRRSSASGGRQEGEHQ